VHSYVDIDEVERLSFGPHNMQIHLQEELKRVALFVWEKYEDQEVFEAIMLFAYQINIGDGAYLPKGDDTVENMQLCLTLLRDHIQQHVQVGTEVIPAKQIYQLASSYLDQEMLIHLAQANAGAIRQQTFELVLPILHHIRHRDTLSALKLQEKLESTCAYDPEWYHTFDLIGDQILEQMQQAKRSTSNVSSTQSTSFQPVVKRHPLERVSVKQRLDDIRQNVMAYFFAGTAEGSMRIVSLGMIAGLVFLVGLSFNAVGKMLNEPVTQTASSVPAYRFEDETEKIIKELQKRKNEFKGIQLETGAMPFMECFGPGIAGSGAGNSITIRNDSPFDAVAALKMRDSVAIIRHAYVRKGEQITFYNIPEGEHRLKFYMGNDWANIKPNACNLHGAFYTKPHYRAMSRRSKPLVFGQGTTQYVRLTDDNNWESRTFYGISARNFFSSQHYLKKH
ncbi:MAG: hypothetical protein MRY78_16465, partial [Saprospiraceae bacterium]|nr:hypothetical protein [Saprospiraceae bacterium]